MSIRFKTSSPLSWSFFLLVSDMGGKEAFLTLPPELRAMALAGHYLQSFALMEAALNHCIGKGLNLNSLQETIVCKNVSFRDKTHILQTLLSMAPVSPSTKKRHQRLLSEIAGFSTDRNMVAHDIFVPDNTGKGIQFLVAKAKKELQYPTIVWSVDDTESKVEAMQSASLRLDKIANMFENTDIIRSTIEDGDRNGLETISKLFQLGFLSQEDLHPQESPLRHRHKTNRPKDHETPRKSQE